LVLSANLAIFTIEWMALLIVFLVAALWLVADPIPIYGQQNPPNRSPEANLSDRATGMEMPNQTSQSTPPAVTPPTGREARQP
jgi:hypothetical protein